MDSSFKNYQHQRINNAFLNDNDVFNSNHANFVNNPMINYPFQYYGSSPSAPPFPIPRTKSKLVSRKVKVKSANSRKTFAIFGCMITSFITICLITLVILYAIVPCIFTTCNVNAYCVNRRAFIAQCVCNYGFSGNGKRTCEECGMRAKSPNIRIIGGSLSVDSSWPEAAYILFSYSTNVPNSKEIINYSSFCGGTLINQRHVVTAAHCIPLKIEYKGLTIPVVINEFFKTYESMIKVYLAVYNRTVISKTTTQNAFTVQKLIKHENYDPSKLLNDLAILRLNENVVFNNEIQPCCLPDTNSSDFPSSETESFVIGWGQTESGNSSSYLKNAKIQIFDSNKCSNVSIGIKKSWDSQICAGDRINRVDTCQGDSGGGLFVQTTIGDEKKLVLSGITSYGEGCASADKPGIYTRIGFFFDWIVQNSDFN